MELRPYLAILRRWGWLIALGVVVAGATAFLVSLIMPPVYEAQAGVVIVRSKEEVTFEPKMRTLTEEELLQGAANAAITESRRDALKALVTTSTVATSVISDVGHLLDEEEQNVDVLLDKVKIKSEGDLITIKIQDTDPAKAAALANAWASRYVEYVNGLYGEASQPLGDIGVQLTEAASNYQEAEEALAQFLGNNEIETLGREIEVRKNIFADYYDTRRRLERLISDAENLRDDLHEEALSSSSSTSTGNSLAVLLLRASAFTMSTQLPVDLQLAVDEMWQAMGNPSTAQEGVESLIETMKERREEVDTLINETPLREEILALQERLERENAKKQELTATRDLAWETYSTLSRKAAEIGVAAEARSAEVRFAMPAIVPVEPVGPRKLLNTLLASAVGAMLAVGAVFTIEYLDNSIKGAEDVAQATGLSTLGSIATFKAKDETHLVTLHNPLSPAAETFRALGIQLGATIQKHPQALLIASSIAQEGKSSIAANLGVVLAQGGNSVVIVDADLRRPVLHRWFGLSNDHGLTNALLKSDPASDIATYLQMTEVKNLQVMASGPLPPNPSILLESERLRPLIERLKGEADFVLFDTPAILGVADALLLGREADAVLLVAEASRTDRQSIQNAFERLKMAGANIMGAILNKVSPDKASLYYYKKPR